LSPSRASTRRCFGSTLHVERCWTHPILFDLAPDFRRGELTFTYRFPRQETTVSFEFGQPGPLLEAEAALFVHAYFDDLPTDVRVLYADIR